LISSLFCQLVHVTIYSAIIPADHSSQTVLGFTFLGSLPWCFALALAGYKLGQHWQQVGSVLHKYDLLIAVALVALVGLFLYRHVQRPGRSGDGDEPQDVARTGGH